jgi:hypothetical protein
MLKMVGLLFPGVYGLEFFKGFKLEIFVSYCKLMIVKHKGHIDSWFYDSDVIFAGFVGKFLD